MLTDILSLVLLYMFWKVATDKCIYDVVKLKPLCGENADAYWLDVAANGNRIASLKSVGYRGGLVTPIVVLWIYGLAVGKGNTATLLSWTFLADRLSPLCFGVYLIHFPVAWCWFWIFHGYEIHPWYAWMVHRTIPLNLWELPALLVVCFFASWAVNEFIVGPSVPKILWLMRTPLYAVYRFFGLCVHDTPSNVPGEGTLQLVLTEIRRLTGTPVRPHTPLAATGLDSFGASALLGVLRTSFPQASSLRPASLAELGTVAALASFLANGASKEAKANKQL